MLLDRPHPESSSGLGERIRQVEMRLIDREEALRRGVHQLGQGLQQALQPWRRGLPALGVTLAVSTLAGAIWGWRRRRKLDGGSAADATAHDGAAGRGVPWVHLMTLGWPMLPAAWRARVSPATASTLVALGLPFVEWLLHGRKPPPPPTAMPSVDLARFAGPWFVMASLRGHGARDLRSLSYVPRVDGDLGVVARGAHAGDGVAATQGLARIVPGSGGAKLRLSHAPTWLRGLPLAWSDHWILHVDAEYQEALVGSPCRERLFVLSRAPQLEPQRHGALLRIARDLGYAVERLAPPGTPGL